MRPLHETLVKFFHKNFAEEIKRLTERRKAKNEELKEITTNTHHNHQVVSPIVPSSPNSPFLPPSLNVHNPHRISSFYAVSQLNGEQISPTSPTSPIGLSSSSSSIINRVAAATANLSRSSSLQAGYNYNHSTANNNNHHQILHNKRISSPLSSDGGGNNNIITKSNRPNGVTLSDTPMLEKRNTLSEKKRSLIFAERRMTLRGWSFNTFNRNKNPTD